MAKFNTGQSFADGDTVTGAKLNNITGLLDIYSGVIADQTSIAATVSTADLLLIADTDAGSSGAANKVTVQKLLNDTLTGGTFTNANLSGQLTYGTATGNRTVSTSATITTGTITTGVIPTLTSSTATLGTTTSTAATITSGTVTNLASTTGTIATLNSTTGTIANLSTTLAGDFTISSGTGTLGTTGVTAGTYGASTVIPQIVVDAKGRVTTVSTSAVSGTEVGSIIAWTTGTAPSGYLHCDGAAINRTTYATLFGVLSTTYGTGNGSTTFNIPDYRGRFLRGFASGQATDPDRASRTNRGDGTTGDNVGTKQSDEFKAHTHNFDGEDVIGTFGGGAGFSLRYNPASQTTGTTGGNETRPTNIAVMWCIKF